MSYSFFVKKNCHGNAGGITTLNFNSLLFCQFPNTPIFIIIILSFIAAVAAYLVYVSAVASGVGLAGNVDQELHTKEQGGF